MAAESEFAGWESVHAYPTKTGHVNPSADEGDGISVVNRAHCIGCGLCLTGCSNDVVRLERKPEGEIIHPPADFAAWEHERLHKRQPTD